MRSVVVSNAMTLDGYYTGPGNNPMVLNMDAGFDAHNLERMRSASMIVLGRRSFKLFSSFWPGVADAPEDPTNPTLSEGNRELSRRYREVPKLVVSDRLVLDEDHPWRDSTEVISRASATLRIARERAGDGGEIVVYGSRMLWNSLLSRGLVDELHLVIGPNAVGDGVPLFEKPAKLRLLEARRLEDSDNVLHRYAPVD